MSANSRNDAALRLPSEGSAPLLRFGTFAFDTTKLELTRNGSAVRLQAQPARLLRLLLLHAGDLVPRDTICSTLWDDGINVDFDVAVNRCIRQIRAALDDQIDAPHFIKTIPRLGYSFIAAVATDVPAPLTTESVSGVDSVSDCSIVVLPFSNLSGQARDEYFCDGLAEELTNVLAQVHGLKVIARTSAFAYKGKNEDVRRIAEALGVNHVLEGSVRRSGHRVRVTVQLIRASDGVHQLAKRYDHELADIFAMQDEISADVVRQLRLHLLSARHTTGNIEAYQAQLEGRFHWNRYQRLGFIKALECYELASRLDSEYASACTGIAASKLGLVRESGASALELLPAAERAARRALELDSSDAEAHAALGEIAAMLHYDWKLAQKHFQIALELGPSTYVRCSYATYFLIPLGRTAEALAQAEQVIAHDPLSVMGYQVRAAASMFAKDFAAAERSCSRALELIDTFPRGLQMMAMVKSFQRQDAEAIQWADRLLQVIGRTYLSLHTLAMTKAAAGERDAAESVLAELTSLPAIDQRLPTGVGLVKLILGDVDAAIGWLTKAVEQREPSVLWVHMLPRAPLLVPDSRFKDLLRQMNLPYAESH